MGSSKESEPVSGFDGCRVLVVEDQYLLADDLKKELEDHGAKVVGPINNLGAAQDQVSRDGFDVAVIDVKLGNELAWSIADELMQQKNSIWVRHWLRSRCDSRTLSAHSEMGKAIQHVEAH
jgi:DNA-binding NarL/FixJ family response regulator